MQARVVDYKGKRVHFLGIGGSSMSGGKASVVGTFAGILILGIVSNVLDMWGISINLQGLVKGLVILVAVLIQRVR